MLGRLGFWAGLDSQGSEFFYLVGYFVLLTVGQLRKNGQRNNFCSDTFGDREVTSRVAEILVGLLQMQRNTIFS